MVQLLDPQEGESIYDPACGSGGYARGVRQPVRTHGQDPRTLRLYGQEVQATTAAIARMNLYLHDIETFAIKRGDSCASPSSGASGSLTCFDLVVANPPFSLKNWGRAGWVDDPFGRSAFGVPPESYADLAFVEHMMASMNGETGRLAVVMPHGALFRGSAEQDIRRNMIEAGLGRRSSDCRRISSTTPLFRRPSSSAGRSLAIGPGARPLHRLVGAFHEGLNQNSMASADVDAVVTAFRTGEDPDGEAGLHMRLVSLEEIAANHWDLNIGRYVEVEAEAEVELSAAIATYAETRERLRQAEPNWTCDRRAGFNA